MRTFKVRGQEVYGIELAREGSQVTVRTNTAAWPFPCDKTFDRSELVFMHGDPEPAPEPTREEPLAEPGPADTTGSLFEDPAELESLETGEADAMEVRRP